MFVGIIVDMLSAVNIFTGQIIPARRQAPSLLSLITLIIIRYFEDFLIPNENWLGKVFFFITYGGRCVQGATATILSFCRVSAVCFPVLYRKVGRSEDPINQFIPARPAYLHLHFTIPSTLRSPGRWVLVVRGEVYLLF